jgi:hypothetical protein
MSLTRVSALAGALAILLSAGCDDDSTSPDNDIYQASLTAAAEIPTPVGSPTATGQATATLTEDNMLTVVVTVSGNLTSAVTMAHIHGPAPTTTTAGIVFDFVPSMTSVISAGARTGTIVNATYDLDNLTVSSTGVLRMSATDLIAMLNNGTAYVNVHTVTNPAGEIRGQLLKTN